MDDSERAVPIPVRSLMTEIAAGIGEGHKKLVEASATAHGTLAVKEADVTVEFQLSTTATSVDLQGPSLGALTLLGLDTSETVQSSRATITFHIVPIAAPQPDRPPRPPDPPTPDLRDSILKTIAQLRRKIAAQSPLPDERRLLAELDAIERRAASGDLEGASQALTDFVQRHPWLWS